MLKIEDKEIHINRGEDCIIELERENGLFKVGDKIKLSIVDKNDYNDVFFQQEYEVDEESKLAKIYILKEYTRFAEIKRRPLNCRYEIELNNSIVLVGANDDDDNKITIYPEAGEKK